MNNNSESLSADKKAFQAVSDSKQAAENALILSGLQDLNSKLGDTQDADDWDEQNLDALRREGSGL